MDIDFDVVISQLVSRVAELERQNALLNGVIAAQEARYEDLIKGATDGTLQK